MAKRTCSLERTNAAANGAAPAASANSGVWRSDSDGQAERKRRGTLEGGVGGGGGGIELSMPVTFSLSP